MQNNRIQSDQLYNWSDDEPFNRYLAPSAPDVGQTSGPTPSAHSQGISHRALQAVWPSQLQMPTRPGTRAQILPFGKPGWCPAGDGLCPRGICKTGLRILAEFPSRPPGTGEHLQYQPRIVKTTSKVLNRNARGAFTPISVGPRLSWDARRQYLAELVASRAGLAHCN